MTSWTKRTCSKCSKELPYANHPFCPFCGANITKNPPKVEVEIVEDPVTCGWCHIRFRNEKRYDEHNKTKECNRLRVQGSLVGSIITEGDANGASVYKLVLQRPSDNHLISLMSEYDEDSHSLVATDLTEQERVDKEK